MVQKPDGIFGLFDVVRDFYAHGIDEHPWVLFLVIVIFSDIQVQNFAKEQSATQQ